MKTVGCLAGCFAMLLGLQIGAAPRRKPIDPQLELSTKLVDTGLRSSTQRVLRRYLSPDKTWLDYTVEEVLSINPRWVQGELTRGEIDAYLAARNLKMGMTNHELEFYRLNGRLPVGSEAMTDETDVKSLKLTSRARSILIGEGIFFIGDRHKTSVEELLRAPRAGQATVREIENAFKEAGFDLYRDQAERLCAAGVETAREP